MTTVDDKELARERLLHAALVQVFDERERPTVPLPSPARSSPARFGPARWLVAAAVLVGVAVVVGSALLREAGPAPNVADEGRPQDPEPVAPMPGEVTSDAQQLGEVPESCANLAVHFGDEPDFSLLRRFVGLRRLVVLRERRGEQGAHDYAQDDIARLLHLKDLEEIRFLTGNCVGADDVRMLAGLPKLRALQFARLDATVGAAEAIAALPQLQRLDLSLVKVGADFLRALPARLRHLGLHACPGMDAAAYAALGRLRALRSLTLTSQSDEGTCAIAGTRHRFASLGAAAFDALNGLPELRELDLDESHFDDRFMSQLPPRLEVLNLGFHVMTPSTIRDLKRLGALRDLTFHHNTRYDACAELLGALPIETLFLHGWLDDVVVGALARHATLVDVRLTVRREVPLAPLAAAPRLERVRLRLKQDLPWSWVSEQLKAFEQRSIEVTLESGGR